MVDVARNTRINLPTSASAEMKLCFVSGKLTSCKYSPRTKVKCLSSVDKKECKLSVNMTDAGKEQSTIICIFNVNVGSLVTVFQAKESLVSLPEVHSG